MLIISLDDPRRQASHDRDPRWIGSTSGPTVEFHPRHASPSRRCPTRRAHAFAIWPPRQLF
jgi:hypothetical protein